MKLLLECEEQQITFVFVASMLCCVLQWALHVILYSPGLRADSTVSLFFWTFFAILTSFLATRTDHFHAVVQYAVLQQYPIWWAKIFKFCPCPVHPESWRRMQMHRLIIRKTFFSVIKNNFLLHALQMARPFVSSFFQDWHGNGNLTLQN
jgi:hypothetical protein